MRFFLALLLFAGGCSWKPKDPQPDCEYFGGFPVTNPKEPWQNP